MALSSYVKVGLALTVALLGLGLLFFVQYKDPMFLMMPFMTLLPIWGIIGIVYVLQRGIPVRIVEDERRREP